MPLLDNDPISDHTVGTLTADISIEEVWKRDGKADRAFWKSTDDMYSDSDMRMLQVQIQPIDTRVYGEICKQ